MVYMYEQFNEESGKCIVYMYEQFNDAGPIA